MSHCGSCMNWDDLECHVGKVGFCEVLRERVGRDFCCGHFWSVFGFVPVSKKDLVKQLFFELR